MISLIYTTFTKRQRELIFIFTIINRRSWLNLSQLPRSFAPAENKHLRNDKLCCWFLWFQKNTTLSTELSRTKAEKIGSTNICFSRTWHAQPTNIRWALKRWLLQSVQIFSKKSMYNIFSFNWDKRVCMQFWKNGCLTNP